MGPASVDGVPIPEAAIAAEMQLHPASSLDAAWTGAARALVIRQLLLAEAERAGITAGSEDGESAEEARIRALLAERIAPAEPDEAACRAHWEAHPERWQSPVVYEAAHILFAAAPDDAAARARAKAAAEETLAALRADPGRFAALAREHSACPSAAQGGQLGQQRRGDLVEEIETFAMSLEPGQICPVAVATRYGYHVLRLDRRAEPATLPYAAVFEAVRRELRARAWQSAVHDWLRALAAPARIEGVTL